MSPAGAIGFIVVAIILWDAYETILLPRRLPADIRLSRLVLRALWLTWRASAAGSATESPRALPQLFLPRSR